MAEDSVQSFFYKNWKTLLCAAFVVGGFWARVEFRFDAQDQHAKQQDQRFAKIETALGIDQLNIVSNEK